MKFVIQRVLEANVKVAGDIVGKIDKGLLVLVGFTHSDKSSDIDFAANKLLNLRLFDDSQGNRWKESVKSSGLEILFVSQFTLYSILKGNKPDFHNALDPEPALKMYNTFVDTLRKLHTAEKIQCGKFGEMMEVSLVNDGPVTINWEYPEIKENQNNERSNKSSKTNSKTASKNKNITSDKTISSSGGFPITEEELKKFNESTAINEDTNKIDLSDNQINI